MTTPVGGARDRVIIEAVQVTIRDSLEALGWFDAGRSHKDIELIYRELDPDEEAAPNTLAIFAESIDSDDAELGSNATVDTRTFYVDFFGDPGDPHVEAVGEHLSGDLRAILLGHLPAIGRDFAHIEVMDWSMTTPQTLFYCQVVDVVKDRGRNPSNASQRFWWTVRFDVVDDVWPEAA